MWTVYISYELICGPQPYADKKRVLPGPLHSPHPAAIRSSLHVHIFILEIQVFTVASFSEEVLL